MAVRSRPLRSPTSGPGSTASSPNALVCPVGARAPDDTLQPASSGAWGSRAGGRSRLAIKFLLAIAGFHFGCSTRRSGSSPTSLHDPGPALLRAAGPADRARRPDHRDRARLLRALHISRASARAARGAGRHDGPGALRLPRTRRSSVRASLALPTLLTGIRIATVSTISIATVAPFVDPEGARQPDLRRASAGGLPDGDLHRRRARGALALVADGLLCSPSALTQSTRAAPYVVLAEQFRPGAFVDAFTDRRPSLLFSKPRQTVKLSAVRSACVVARAAARALARPSPARPLRRPASPTSVAPCRASSSRLRPHRARVGFWNNAVALVVLAVPPILINS